MNTIDMEAARPYIVAGCHLDGAHVIGTVAEVVDGLVAVIARRVALSPEAFAEASGAKSMWHLKDPRQILDAAGWGADRNGNLIGGAYELRKTAQLTASFFGA